MNLRPYQEQAVAAVLDARERGLSRVLYTMPTGCGKTQAFVEIARRMMAAVQRPALVIAHREELLDQAAHRFQAMMPGVWVDVEQGPRRAGHLSEVVVASVQTLSRSEQRLSWLHPGVVICDEAHHAPAAGYRKVFTRFGCFSGEAYLVGCTATPKRLDKLNLHAIFEEQVFDYSIRTAIRDGWLCDVRGYRVKSQVDLSKVHTTAGDFNQAELAEAVNVAARTDAAIKHWQEVAAARSTIVFCASVAHAQDAAAAFCERGISAEFVHGGMKPDERQGVLARFTRGRTQVLTNVEVLTEGFDHPPTSCVVMLRPTQSWGLYAQMIGRGTRICDGKSDLVVVDVVDNCQKHSLASVPAILDLPADLDLEGKSLSQAADMLDELGEQAAVLATYEPQTYRELETTLQQVDLFARVEPPQEVKKLSRLAWIRLHDGSYLLDVDHNPRRVARILPDMLGMYRCSLQQGDEVRTHPQPAELHVAFQRADRAVERAWPDLVRRVVANAPWRYQPPTEKQVGLLRRLGYASEAISALNKGQASGLITAAKAARPQGAGRAL